MFFGAKQSTGARARDNSKENLDRSFAATPPGVSPYFIPSEGGPELKDENSPAAFIVATVQ